MRAYFLTIASTAIFGLATTTSAHAVSNLIANGSFESPSIPANSYHGGTPASWGWDTMGLIFNGIAYDFQTGTNWPGPQDGLQFVDIGNRPTMLFQYFCVADRSKYTLTWYDNTHYLGTSSPYSVSVDDFTNYGNLLSLSLDAAHAGIWQQHTVTLDLPPGTYLLSFAVLGEIYTHDTLLDNIALASTVPEPTRAILILIGVSTFGLSRLRLTKPGDGCRRISLGTPSAMLQNCVKTPNPLLNRTR